ncbi:MAG: monovalent cation/H(+) antiporter subunit G [Clostridiales bacterium]|nr:monovalent cation/H(+) antiporter subunit G [Clostridiales bacterium]
MSLQNIAAIILVSAGFIFLLISAVGVIKLPSFYTRIHASGVGETLGALLFILGLIIASGFKIVSIKIFIVFVILAFTNPLGTNLIMLGACRDRNYRNYNNLKPSEETGDAEEEMSEERKD